ncbi:MAG TPA: D-isomer specific 2-hydroxyacid dehydrogenase family protein [Candidatus Corynebacterium avicola]|uniref:D-isomer specific 2-hydroxyacid dehydrogenase family protein n=1 Tax=Candidatus Corynebacterium avicola TaxID=2838527 RepID=A0A9D1RS17_9CORY|nr:D-isomer specific 2-hydroxyacid dehydrogenase family protein [Candidatus Corynebacterium avicola]
MNTSATAAPANVYFAGHPLPKTSAALQDAGAVIVDNLDEADAVISHGVSPTKFPDLPERVRWVQLCQAGIEAYFDAGVVTPGPSGTRRWTNAAGMYGRQVAESAMGLLLSVTHLHKRIALARTWGIWEEIDEKTRWLAGSTVAVVGAGGIGHHLSAMLAPFGAEVLAVNRSGRPVEGARETVTVDRLDEVLAAADHVIIALPLTDETRGLFNAELLASCRPGVTIVNVARGPVIVTEDLVAALESGQVGGAGLDVTDPEPLPDGHPLWDMDNVTITTHSANTRASMDYQLAGPVTENYRAFVSGERMPTEFEPSRGY